MFWRLTQRLRRYAPIKYSQHNSPYESNSIDGQPANVTFEIFIILNAYSYVIIIIIIIINSAYIALF